MLQVPLHHERELSRVLRVGYYTDAQPHMIATTFPTPFSQSSKTQMTYRMLQARTFLDDLVKEIPNPDRRIPKHPPAARQHVALLHSAHRAGR